MGSDGIILQTKVSLPPLRKDFIERSHLCEAMTPEAHQSLTILAAPAGFGKTTLLASWGAQSEVALAWLSLDEKDNTLTRFFQYMLAAFERHGVSFPAELSQNSAFVSEAVLQQFLSVLEQQESLPYLALDDYHFIESPDIHDAMLFLIEHWPRMSHIFLATRTNPRFPLGLWQVKDKLNVLDINVLRFEQEEAQVFLQTTMGLSLNEGECLQLFQETEGWAAGLQMAALSRRSWQKSSWENGRSRQLFGQYMLSELLERQEEDIRTFLLHTSILKRMDVAVCSHLTGNPDSHQVLEQLVNTHMFLVPMEQSHRWFRYHQLFAEALSAHLQQRDSELYLQLHHSAMQWFSEQKLWEDAFEHAVHVQDWKSAATLLGHILAPLWQGGQTWSILQWLEPLPEEWLLQVPQLGIYWISAKVGRDGPHPSLLEKLAELEQCVAQHSYIQMDEAIFPNTQEELLLQCHYVRLELSWFSNQIDEVLSTVELVRSSSIQSKVYPFAYSYLIEGMMLDAIGASLTKVRACYQTVLDQSIRLTDTANSGLYAIWGLAWCDLDDNKVMHAWKRCQDAIAWYESEPAEERPPAFHLSPLYAMLAQVAIEQCDWDVAKTYCKLALQYISNNLLGVLRYYIFLVAAAVDMLSGEFEQAETMLLQTTQSLPLSSMHGDAMALQALLYLQQGRWDEALRWDQSCQFSTEEQPSKRWLTSYHAHTALLLVQESWEEAADWLQWLEAYVATLGRERITIEVLLWKVVWAAKQGLQQQALVSLKEGVRLAGKSGCLYALVQHKDVLQPLLQALEQEEDFGQIVTPLYWESLIKLVGRDEQDNRATESESKQHSQLEAAPVLSPRELEIVTLASQGCTNREIGTALHVSPETVKSHMKNVFAKLEVRSRAQAVARVRDLGLL